MSDSGRFKATHLADILERNERSQSWLARKVGVSVTLMHYIVNGERSMSRELAEQVGALFNVPLFLFCESTDVKDSIAMEEVA